MADEGETEWVEPCAYVRMRRAGWPAARIADLFGVNIFVVAKAIQDADREARHRPKPHRPVTARVHLIRFGSRFERCCECSRPATHIAYDEASSPLCNTHLPAWMAWRGLRFNYEGAA